MYFYQILEEANQMEMQSSAIQNNVSSSFIIYGKKLEDKCLPGIIVNEPEHELEKKKM